MGLQTEIPIGGIIPYYSPVAIGSNPLAPTRWEFCDGTTVSDPESPIFGMVKPELMVVGTSGSTRMLRGIDATANPTWGGGSHITSGSDTHSHTINSDGSHSHNGSTSVTGDHTHSISVSGNTDSAGSHVHNAEAVAGGFEALIINDRRAGPAGNHTHTVNVSGNSGTDGNHSHGISIGTNGSHTHGGTTVSESTIPAVQAVMWLIKVR